METLSTLVKNRSMFQINAQILEEIYRKKLILGCPRLLVDKSTVR